MHEVLYVRCSISGARGFGMFFDATYWKLMHLLWHLQILLVCFITSYKKASCKKANWEFNVVVLQNFPRSLQFFLQFIHYLIQLKIEF